MFRITVDSLPAAERLHIQYTLVISKKKEPGWLMTVSSQMQLGVMCCVSLPETVATVDARNTCAQSEESRGNYAFAVLFFMSVFNLPVSSFLKYKVLHFDEIG